MRRVRRDTPARRSQPLSLHLSPPRMAGGPHPQFATCKEAKANGYGRYYRGVDPSTTGTVTLTATGLSVSGDLTVPAAGRSVRGPSALAAR
ncbi:hypothetical protein GCM10011509_10800 [Ornithinimicrobium pekingense]|uniref:Uncharacterized protein n=1 Tax=Ornithinimicrobium pekingense TaxID=384677 RepID=A0ABQ2F5Y2_9MICO|nr:hypothetical protein GCM10011509_10800 [Ornithinimicrobium pekingense]